MTIYQNRFIGTLNICLLLFFVSCTEKSPDSDWVGSKDMRSSQDLADDAIFGADQYSSDLESTDSSPDMLLPDISVLPLSNALSVQEIGVSLEEEEVVFPLENATNSIPFLTSSYRLGDPTLKYLHIDATIENEALVLSRYEDLLREGESVLISGQVVAFDPTRVRVQCHAFRTASISAKIPVDGVSAEKTFINFWSKIATGSNDKNLAFLSARFDEAESIIVERVSPAGTLSGHLCLAESIDDSFTVQHLVSKISTGSNEVLIPIESIDPNRSFVLVSHQSTSAQSVPGHSQLSCQLESNSVRCLRGLAENEIADLRVQVVSFKDRTQVTRHHIVIEEGTKEAIVESDTATKNPTIILGGVGVLGEVSTSGSLKTDVPASHIEAVVEGTQIRFRRGEPWTGRLEFFPQIIIW